MTELGVAIERWLCPRPWRRKCAVERRSNATRRSQVVGPSDLAGGANSHVDTSCSHAEPVFRGMFRCGAGKNGAVCESDSNYVRRPKGAGRRGRRISLYEAVTAEGGARPLITVALAAVASHWLNAEWSDSIVIRRPGGSRDQGRRPRDIDRSLRRGRAGPPHCDGSQMAADSNGSEHTGDYLLPMHSRTILTLSSPGSACEYVTAYLVWLPDDLVTRVECEITISAHLCRTASYGPPSYLLYRGEAVLPWPGSSSSRLTATASGPGAGSICIAECGTWMHAGRCRPPNVWWWRRRQLSGQQRSLPVIACSCQLRSGSAEQGWLTTFSGRFSS